MLQKLSLVDWAPRLGCMTLGGHLQPAQVVDRKSFLTLLSSLSIT
jgi:hypothetical protein